MAGRPDVRDNGRTPAAPRGHARRLRVEVHGAVQGVGFRPFVYRLATGLDLSGWVINDTQGVFIEVEGATSRVDEFLRRLPVEVPPRAIVQELSSLWLEPAGFSGFEIRHSANQGARTAFVLPDLATCDDCLAELFDPADRRFRYPFINCTNCGPRFTIIQALPYDRPNTTMQHFALCEACRNEYDDPADRRFHAQPNACPDCGPRLTWRRGQDGEPVETQEAALRAAVAALVAGEIVAVKGLGGFHLMVDARNEAAVNRLRARKPRPHKPLALLVRDVAQAREVCEVSPQAEALLTSPAAPIVLLPRRPDVAVAAAVAPGNPSLGLMLPYTPLHHLLLHDCGFPLVATSGNLSDEPICTTENEARTRLGHISDGFLVHDRPIARHVDDSVAWIVDGAPALLRRARGFAPLPVSAAYGLPPVLAVGAELKNTVALSVGRQVFISQHIGDLETPEALAAFERVIADFLDLYGVQPAAIAHDLHPDYVSTRWAHTQAPARLIGVQHHHAHLAACLAENRVNGPALGVTWDGTGYGSDGTVWGGEFLLGDAGGFTRVAHLRPFRLPGGEAAVHEPARVAFALLWELVGDAALDAVDLPPLAAFDVTGRRVLAQMLRRGVNSPLTTSAGRLFDGIAALIGLWPRVSFEGQAAMALEFATDPAVTDAYPFPVTQAAGGDNPAAALILDWQPLVEAILTDIRSGAARGTMAGRFHNALVEAIVATARQIGEPRVALTGGCFQNRWLTERATQRLRRSGFEVLLHRQVPPNDGGISLGQVLIAAARLEASGPERHE